jgi:hypothetical protein
MLPRAADTLATVPTKQRSQCLQQFELVRYQFVVHWLLRKGPGIANLWLRLLE